MRTALFGTRLACGLVAELSAYSACQAIDIQTVLVGNPGNAGDSRVMNDGTMRLWRRRLRVPHRQVRNHQRSVRCVSKRHRDLRYVRNLRTIFYGWLAPGRNPAKRGAPNYVYTAKPHMGDKPVTGVTTAAAMRFANWLHNGQPSGSQTTATTEAGTYDLTGASLPLTRSSSATWWIPNDNEWYKAAYYDPRDTASGGPPGDSHYWLHATKSMGTPTAATADARRATSPTPAPTP